MDKVSHTHRGTVQFTNLNGYIVVKNNDPQAPNHLVIFNLRPSECEGTIAVGQQGTIQYRSSHRYGLHYFISDKK